MESLFRLLLHEQSLVQEDHPDPKLLKSIEFRRRDLATTLETAKWQLEDFEREVSRSATMDKSHPMENVISRHKQFVTAIREQILNVEKSLGDASDGDLLNSSQWVNLDEQDTNGLALFLSGENPSEHDVEDSNIMRRFLDRTMVSGLNKEIVEHNIGEIENLNMNGFVHLGHNFDMMENKLRKVGSHYSTQMAFEAPSSIREVASERHCENGSWDLEASEATSKIFFDKKKLRGFYSGMNVFGSLGTLWSTNGGGASRSSTKRLKDGEEQRHSPFPINASHAVQDGNAFARHVPRAVVNQVSGLFSRVAPLLGNLQQTSLVSGYSYVQGLFSELLTWLRQRRLGECRARYRRCTYFIQVRQYPVKLLSSILVAVIVLGIMASLVA